jgi:hypothetical protein
MKAIKLIIAVLVAVGSLSVILAPATPTTGSSSEYVDHHHHHNFLG